MVFTLGTVGQNVSFQAKLKSDKEAGAEIRKISDLLTRDIKLADTSAILTVGDKTSHFDDGLVLLNCPSGCNLKYNQTASKPNFTENSDPGANVLIISTKKTYKIYGSDADSKAVFYKEIEKSKLKNDILPSTEIIRMFIDENKISANRLESQVTFSGYCPEKNMANKVASYIQMTVDARTKNFDKLEPKNRAEAMVRTLVAARKY